MKAQEMINLSTVILQPVHKIVQVLIILNMLVLLPACFFSSNTAPTVDLSRTEKHSGARTGTHIVKSGETLYSIAWRYGLDYKSLARHNGIGNDFLIYVGQTLVLSKKSTFSSSKSAASTAKSKSRQAPISSTKKAASSSKSKNVSRSAQNSSISSAKRSTRPEKKSSTFATVTKSNQSNLTITWRWPSYGKVVTNFSSKGGTNKGIDIRGKKGDSVVAAASGRVVYAGSGLRGYGKLVIIKHNDTYLSAYAHNNRIRVREGEKVKAGQHIADIGSSGSRTQSAKLHFEIRRNGHPVNPLRLLPKRKT